MPSPLVQTRSGEKQELHPAKKVAPQLGVCAQRMDQHFVAFRNIEVSSWSDLTQVANGFRKAIAGRFTAVDVERAAVVQSDAKIVAAPESMIPGQPVTDYGWLLA